MVRRAEFRLLLWMQGFTLTILVYAYNRRNPDKEDFQSVQAYTGILVFNPFKS